MNDQTRNLKPTLPAKVAMIVWGNEYAAQNGGSMDFWDQLSDDKKKICLMVLDELNVTKLRNTAKEALTN